MLLSDCGCDLWSVLRGGEGFMRPVEVCAFPPFRQKAAKGWARLFHLSIDVPQPQIS